MVGRQKLHSDWTHDRLRVHETVHLASWSEVGWRVRALEVHWLFLQAQTVGLDRSVAKPRWYLTEPADGTRLGTLLMAVPLG